MLHPAVCLTGRGGPRSAAGQRGHVHHHEGMGATPRVQRGQKVRIFTKPGASPWNRPQISTVASPGVHIRTTQSSKRPFPSPAMWSSREEGRMPCNLMHLHATPHPPNSGCLVFMSATAKRQPPPKPPHHRSVPLPRTTAWGSVSQYQALRPSHLPSSAPCEKTDTRARAHTHTTKRRLRIAPPSQALKAFLPLPCSVFGIVGRALPLGSLLLFLPHDPFPGLQRQTLS